MRISWRMVAGGMALVVLLVAGAIAPRLFRFLRFKHSVSQNYGALRVGMDVKNVSWPEAQDGFVFCRDKAAFQTNEWPDYSKGAKTLPLGCQEMRVLFPSRLGNYAAYYTLEFDNHWILEKIEPLTFGPFAP
jgi:hypothetical protein